MITREMVVKAEENYKTLLKAYHQENTTLVRLEQVPDEYRGDLDCVKILDGVKLKPRHEQDEYDVYKNGILVGKYREDYGNFGKGKLAASYFYPVEGVEVEYVN